MVGTVRSWKYRRRAVFATLTGCGAAVAYVAGWGDDTALHREIAGGALNVVWLTIAVYVGGATADDWLKDRGTPK